MPPSEKDEVREAIGVDELCRRYEKGLDLWTGLPMAQPELDTDAAGVFREDVEDVQSPIITVEVDDSQDNPTH